ncbi:MAG: phosphopantothenate/pantothenate synthetase [Methanocellales archaeon]|nr:phosphopantothenate/pantothenate synthetase [Methanocellales archaeon]
MIRSRDHPRYESLKIREKLVNGFKAGIVCAEGLIAHGRGEAFDYLVGEKTIELAMESTRVAVATLSLAEHPVISVNGNTAALVPDEIVHLSNATNALLEVNLFHRTEERMDKIIDHLKMHGAANVLGKDANARIPNISHERAKMDKEGIYKADVVLVPLEDGDRCEALVNMGKTVIVVDLNPLSRTAQAASITIVDNVIRAIPNMARLADELAKSPKTELERICASYDNKKILEKIIRRIKMI